MATAVKVAALEARHLPAVADLHASGIPSGFLSLLGVHFLRRLYELMARQPGGTVLVALDDQAHCVGFIAGTRDTRSLFFAVLREGWPGLLRLSARALVEPRNLKNALQTLLYGLAGEKKSSAHHVAAELLALAVDKDRRGQGIGRKLIVALETNLALQGVTEYKVVTWAQDEVSNAFYVSCGFELAQVIQHHGRPMNEYWREIGRDTKASSF